LWEILLDVRDHVAHPNPSRGDVACLGVVAQIHEHRGLAGNRNALGVIERFQLFELLFDPVCQLARDLHGRRARPLCLNHHGLDGEVRIFLPPQL
jgi:hypothetical protein